MDTGEEGLYENGSGLSYIPSHPIYMGSIQHGEWDGVWKLEWNPVWEMGWGSLVPFPFFDWDGGHGQAC